MTGMPVTAASPIDTSAIPVLEFLAKKGIDDASLWSVLDRVDRVKLAKLLTDVDTADATKFDKAVNVGMTKASFDSEKSGKKGKIFEQVAATLLSGVACFGARTDIATSTNQLDVLVTMGLWSGVVPAFRQWGTHFICECKFHDKGVAIDWVQKLDSLLGTHGASVGILISKKPITKGGRGNINHNLQMLAVNGTYILSLSRSDLDKCAAGDGIIQMLVDRFIAVQMGLAFLTKESI